MPNDTIKQFRRAIRKGNTEMVKLMIDQDSTLPYRLHGSSPLCLAIRFGKMEIVNLLLQFDSALAKERATSWCDWPLSAAVQYSNMEAFDALVTCLGDAVSDQIDHADYDGYTAMYWAVSNDNILLIERLVALGSMMHMSRARCGSIIHRAAYGGHHQAVETLVRCGSDALDTRNSFGHTPMHCAKNAQTLEALVRCGSKAFNMKDIDGDTPVSQAWKFGGTPELLISFMVLDGSDDCIQEYYNYCNLEGKQPVTWTEDEALDIRFRTYFVQSLVYRLLFPNCVVYVEKQQLEYMESESEPSSNEIELSDGDN
jgi:ankyrin repeat protein